MGSRICVFWPTERNWFSGHVAAFDDSEGLSKIQYDDGDTEWLQLAVECYMLPPTGGFLHASQIYHADICGLECPAGMDDQLYGHCSEWVMLLTSAESATSLIKVADCRPHAAITLHLAVIHGHKCGTMQNDVIINFALQVVLRWQVRVNSYLLMKDSLTCTAQTQRRRSCLSSSQANALTQLCWPRASPC